jgi:hypothetical protein
MFHYADGYRMLENPDDYSNSSLKAWKDFLVNTYNKLINSDFKSQNISFDPELTKVQKFKLNKKNPTIPDILIHQSPGNVVDIPRI